VDGGYLLLGAVVVPVSVLTAVWLVKQRHEPFDRETKVIILVTLTVAPVLAIVLAANADPDQPPPADPIVAVYTDDQVIFVAVRLCAGDELVRLVVTEPPNQVRWSIEPDPGAATPALVRLFEPPAGWRVVDGSSPADRRAGDLAVEVHTRRGHAASVAFDPAALGGPDGRFATPDSVTAVDGEEFDRRNRAFCAQARD
jgi:hypothetical protein